MKKYLLILLLTPIISFGQNPKIKDFKITILSTMLSDFHTGEWGFSAMIEVDGERILFDAGSRENTVLQNAKELNINLDNLDNIFISHNHKDHTGGLITLKKEYPNSFKNAHVGEGFGKKTIELAAIAEPKQLLIIPEAVHTDHYDGGNENLIPFDKFDRFFKENLK